MLVTRAVSWGVAPVPSELKGGGSHACTKKAGAASSSQKQWEGDSLLGKQARQ
jgi:hypothetical protein